MYKFFLTIRPQLDDSIIAGDGVKIALVSEVSVKKRDTVCSMILKNDVIVIRSFAASRLVCVP